MLASFVTYNGERFYTCLCGPFTRPCKYNINLGVLASYIAYIFYNKYLIVLKKSQLLLITKGERQDKEVTQIIGSPTQVICVQFH